MGDFPVPPDLGGNITTAVAHNPIERLRSAKQIGTLLNISHKTVHAFRGQLMEKIGVDSLPELTKYAIRHGLTTVE